MVQRPDGLLTEYAFLSLVPLIDDIPDLAISRILFDLFQAFLAAVFALGPAGTFLQSERRFIDEGSQTCFSGGHIHSGRSTRFGTHYQTFSAKPEIRPHSWNRAKNKQRNGQHQDGDHDGKNRDGHTAPPGSQ